MGVYCKKIHFDVRAENLLDYYVELMYLFTFIRFQCTVKQAALILHPAAAGFFTILGCVKTNIAPALHYKLALDAQEGRASNEQRSESQTFFPPQLKTISPYSTFEIEYSTTSHHHRHPALCPLLGEMSLDYYDFFTNYF